MARGMQRFALWALLLSLAAVLGLLSGAGQAVAQPAGAQFKGLVPGKSTLEEVYVALGRPTKTRSKDDLTLMFWPPSMPPGKVAKLENLVAMRQNVVFYIMVADPAEFEADPFKLVEQLGKPQGLTRNTYSDNSSYYHYPLRGVSYLVDSGPGQLKDTVVAKMVYAPTDWTTLQASYLWARPAPPSGPSE